MRNTFAVVVSVLGLSLASCGGGGGGGTGTPVSEEEFPARYASALCGLMKRCCETSGGTSSPDCEGQLAAEFTSLGAEARADGAMWDAVTAGRCLDRLRAADCAATDVVALVDLLDVCDDTWTGVVPPGGACQTYASCAEPAVSGGATAGASCVNSMCVPVVRQPVGGACSDTGPQVCNSLLASCTANACVALPANGEACTGSCRAGWRCTGGVCVALLATGAACSVDSDCASDTCSGGKCASVLAAAGDYCVLP